MHSSVGRIVRWWRRPRSRLTGRYLLVALPVMLLVALAVSGLLVGLRAGEAHREKQLRGAELARQTAGLLGYPAWNLDSPAIEPMLQVLASTPGVRCARLQGDFIGQLPASGQHCSAQGPAEAFSAPISRIEDGEAFVLGRLLLWFDTRVDAATLWPTLQPLLALLAVLIVALVASAMLAFSRTILTPLARVEASLRVYRHSGERAPVDWRSQDELGDFIADYNDVLLAQELVEHNLHAAVRESEQRLAELSLAQQNLVQSEKLAAAGQLTAGVAHEINNPTNFVAVAAQNLQEEMQNFRAFLRHLAGDGADPEVLAAIDSRLDRQFDQLATILDGAGRIRGIVRDLRAFSRLDEAERKPAQLMPALQSILNLVATQYRYEVQFETDFAADPEIECQPARLNQVFMNVIINACHAIAARALQAGPDFVGRLRIASAFAPGQLCIEFRDNGCGMNAATRQRIFEPFFTTKPVGEGTGLGLSVSYGIVKEHGGVIEIESTPQVGSCFRVCLPILAPTNGLPP